MASIRYKTRNMSNPQGKPRVYFCCHPEDFDRYFERISDELLAKQNCAIYYLDDLNAVRDEEFLADLRQMQLFVMPVTTKLLCTENRALSEEFSFAMESHIPVLPLMQERGLEELFNQKCGDLQFLDKHSNDPTAISYEEKLDKYLSSVLIGDELAEKIRAAFDAYVFLSYRKKDRTYAQELMRLIHKNEFCRDIAIWYDEFLTPGENFNDSIKVALKKSGLFVMAVTPNLVNETNYIMTTEYPMARQEGKPILPAELVPTDREQLAEKYEDIPACTDAHDEIMLSEALMKAIQKMAIKENDTSPEHNFFIGLAYLGGVDVEVDHERAVSLITSSAEAGLVEATEKLVEMYRTGLGVVRNYETAVQWQEKLVVQSWLAHQNQPSEDALNFSFWAEIDCGDYYADLGKLNKAKEHYLYALKKCGGETSLPGFLHFFKSKWVRALLKRRLELVDIVLPRRNLVVAYRRLGYIHHAKGNLNGAKEYYQKCFVLSEQLAREAETAEARSDLSDICIRLGDFLLSEVSRHGAKEYYQKAFEISERLVKEVGTAEAHSDLSACYRGLGYILRLEFNRDGAMEHYQKCLAICEQMDREMETAEAHGDLASIYDDLGDMLRGERDYNGAKEYYQKGLVLREQLVRETEAVKALRDLSFSYDRLGGILKLEGDLHGAKEYYNKALIINERLAGYTGTRTDVDSLATTYYSLHLVGSDSDDEFLKKAIEIYQKLHHAYPDVRRYRSALNVIEYNSRLKQIKDARLHGT